MRSSKPRKIILKIPKFERIRNNLRIILRLAYLDERTRLSNKIDIYQKKYIQNNGRLTPSQLKRKISITQTYTNLGQEYQKSILVCSREAGCLSYKEMVSKGVIEPSDRPINLNMVWVPHNNAWYCTECYERYYKVKVCEQCYKFDENSVEILECYICNRYLCGSCQEYCPDCRESYCYQCYFDHLDNKKCRFKDKNSLF